MEDRLATGAVILLLRIWADPAARHCHREVRKRLVIHFQHCLLDPVVYGLYVPDPLLLNFLAVGAEDVVASDERLDGACKNAVHCAHCVFAHHNLHLHELLQR